VLLCSAVLRTVVEGVDGDAVHPRLKPAMMGGWAALPHTRSTIASTINHRRHDQ
jgi:hypothetical protein